MQEKEWIESLLVNTVKEIRKERRRMTLWSLVAGVLIIGTALVHVPYNFGPTVPSAFGAVGAY